MEARRSSVSKDVCWEDVVQPMEGVETGLEASVVLPPIEPNVVPTGCEVPSSSLTVPSADAAGRP